MDFGWLMEVYVWEMQCNLAIWVQYIYEVMTGLYCLSWSSATRDL
jgi:hypothetical protein